MKTLALLILVCCLGASIGCKDSPIAIGSSESSTPKGTEPHLVLIYLDDSGSVDTSGPKNSSRRKEYFALASQFVRALKPAKAEDVAVNVSAFQVDCNPLSDLTFRAKMSVLQSLVQYKESKTGRDPNMKGTSLRAVLKDAKSRIDSTKPVSTTIVILSDGATEDQNGGSLTAFESEARAFAGTAGVNMAIAGITGMQNGTWPRFLSQVFKGKRNVKLGKNDVDSQSVVQWAAERFNEAAK